MTTGFDFPDDYDEIVATRKAALAARQEALLDYDSTPTEEEAIDLIRDAADSSGGSVFNPTRSYLRMDLSTTPLKYLLGFGETPDDEFDVVSVFNVSKHPSSWWTFSGDTDIIDFNSSEESIFLLRPGLWTISITTSITCEDDPTGRTGAFNTSLNVNRIGPVLTVYNNTPTTMFQAPFEYQMTLNSSFTLFMSEDDFWLNPNDGDGDPYNVKPLLSPSVGLNTELGRYQLVYTTITFELVEFS